jgi:hypothetical protein
MKEHLFDKRVVRRALQEGLLDKDLYQRMLDELPDLSHKVQTAAEAQAQEAASQAREAAQAAASASSGAAAQSYDAGDDLDDEDDDDLDDEDGAEAAPADAAQPGDTIEMERPRIPGSYSDY